MTPGVGWGGATIVETVFTFVFKGNFSSRTNGPVELKITHKSFQT
jgi:hypothetical protein